MGNTMPPRASRETTGRRGAGTEVAPPPATPSRVVAAARKQGRGDDDVEEEEEETTRAGGADGGAAPAVGGKKVLTVKIVMTRKDAEALVARLKARSARERKARMAELKGQLRAGSCGGVGVGGASPAWSRDAPRRPMLPPIKEK